MSDRDYYDAIEEIKSMAIENHGYKVKRNYKSLELLKNL